MQDLKFEMGTVMFLSLASLPSKDKSPSKVLVFRPVLFHFFVHMDDYQVLHQHSSTVVHFSNSSVIKVNKKIMTWVDQDCFITIKYDFAVFNVGVRVSLCMQNNPFWYMFLK